MIYSVIALMLIVLVEPLILDTLYGGGGSFDPGKELVRENISKAISAGRLQVLAVIEWIKALTVFLGVAFLIFSAAQFMRDFGGEEQVGKQKTVLTWMAVGFIVIAVDQILIEEILYKAILGSANKVYFEQNPSRGILEAVGIMKYFLQFLAAIGFAMIIYGGVLMITNYASEENQEKGKKILITAGIGFLIIAMSYILVNSLATGKVL
ncbi:hypothetical protein HZA38_04890 [Candidatus Peregrinibacteria bacterium]|nr:hypothetical protein [Candidatus Peregrinibacteria bacterium]